MTREPLTVQIGDRSGTITLDGDRIEMHSNSSGSRTELVLDEMARRSLARALMPPSQTTAEVATALYLLGSAIRRETDSELNRLDQRRLLRDRLEYLADQLLAEHPGSLEDMQIMLGVTEQGLWD